MVRAVRKRGVVAASVWDYACRLPRPVSMLWDAARELDPDLSTSHLAGVQGHLARFDAAGLVEIVARLTRSAFGFEEWWERSRWSGLSHVAGLDLTKSAPASAEAPYRTIPADSARLGSTVYSPVGRNDGALLRQIGRRRVRQCSGMPPGRD
jgi:hypothetical protein